MAKTKKRFTIGCLFDFLYEDYADQIFNNILLGCREHDLNIIGFGGGTFRGQLHKYREQKNVIFDLVSRQSVDGIIALTGLFGNFVNVREVEKLLAKYNGLPIVGIGLDIKGVPSILLDNALGMKALLAHIIEFHKRKRIAFIRGAQENYDAVQRFSVYKEVLKAYGLALDKKLIVEGNFDYFYGIEAVKILLDERKVKFDALVSSNDAMAIYAMEELQRRGFNVPGDVLVTGFDDIELCQAVRPKLTTIKQSFYDLGRASVGAMLSLLKGERVPEKIVLPSSLVIRESCGCSELETIDGIMSHDTYSGMGKKIPSPTQGATIDFAAVMAFVKRELAGIAARVDIDTFIKCFLELDFADRTASAKKEIFAFFKELFVQLFEKSVDLYDVYKLIIVLFKRLAKREKENKIRNDLILLQREVLILVGLVYQNYYTEQKAILKDEDKVVFRINEEFIHTFDLVQLRKIISSQLPKLGLQSFFLCLYNGLNREQARVLLHYDVHGGNVHFSRKAFPAAELVPGGLAADRRFEYVLMALYFKKEHLGYILFEFHTLNGAIYETLATQISSAIKGASLTTELHEYTHTLQEKVKERTKELEEANRKLKELDSVKNDFIANITHDFRSPLTAILNVADLALKYNVHGKGKARDDFKIIHEGALKLKKTIDSLLDLAKMDAQGLALKITRINIVALVNSIVDFYSSSVIGSGIKIIRKLPVEEIVNFYNDAEKLEEVINNVMSNAIKFVDPEHGLITVALEEDKGKIRIIISDDGIGIEREKLQVIFNRFTQAYKEKNSMYHGTGIGLSFSKQLVSYMKGNIWAESEGENKGSRFIVEFQKGKGVFSTAEFYNGEISARQYADEKAIIQAELKTKLEKQEVFAHFGVLNKEEEFDYKKGKILVIEDDKNIRKIIIQYLFHDSYQNFIQAANGRQGLEAVYEYTPDLIICDYYMPYMKGDEFHDKVLANPNFRNIPCIFLSAIADDSIIIERKQKGAGAYLKKPIDEKDFLLTVEQQLRKYFEYLKTTRLSTMDELTGLFNRRAIYGSLVHELYIRRYRDLSVITMDIDRLKKINDTHGHAAGDKILWSVGEILRLSLRNYDITGRYGGEEFVIILPETNLQNSVAAAQGLRGRIRNNHFGYDGKKLEITASFGVASLRDNAAHINEALGGADIQNIFEVKNPSAADWKKIEDYKLQIADTLLKMAFTSLEKAKQTSCAACGYSSKNEELFVARKCPQCGGERIEYGRDRVAAFE